MQLVPPFRNKDDWFISSYLSLLADLEVRDVIVDLERCNRACGTTVYASSQRCQHETSKVFR